MTEAIPIKDYVDQRFAAQEIAVDKALAAAKEAVVAALAASEKAVDKAEVSAERWRNSANEWRGAMSDRERDFLSRKEFYSIVATAVAVITLIVLMRGV